MFTHHDIQHRSIFVINSLDQKTIRVRNGELLLQETDSEKILTKLPFQKILALFVLGNLNVTSPLLEKCKQFGIALAVLRMNFRPIFFFSDIAEANFLLRKNQYGFSTDNLSIAKHIVANKISNQAAALKHTRIVSPLIDTSLSEAKHTLAVLNQTSPSYDQLMGLEGAMASSYFKALFHDLNWHSRQPRVKADLINATLDIGYTVLFNFIEVFTRLFGFDPYVGVYHKLWFKRKSLICDLIEPFRPIIDHAVRKSWKLHSFSIDDFTLINGQFQLKPNKSTKYSHFFFETLIPYKIPTFDFLRSYYRHFMQNPQSPDYTPFIL